MGIDNLSEVERVIQNVNYYRLSAYYIPFQDSKDVFNSGTTFADVFGLYKFDRNLRLLFLDIIELIEISLRTKVSYHLANNYGPFGYLDRNLYHKNFNYDHWFDILDRNIQKSHEVFVKQYFAKYSDKHLPIWMASEVISFGDLSVLYKNLQFKDKQTIARRNFRIDQTLLTSWLHSLVYIRNLCAHHSRLWNRSLSISPKVPRKNESWKKINSKRIFSILLLLKILCPDDSYWEKWVNKLQSLINKYNPKILMMGFPKNWEDYL
ncbi:Abi family protein [Candidatus Calescamantes bacterium]|nr:Abi family protein [Candidatus Calescamantes bacterium]